MSSSGCALNMGLVLAPGVNTVTKKLSTNNFQSSPDMFTSMAGGVYISQNVFALGKNLKVLADRFYCF